jgi:NADH:ubiquinone oxidoreductase subunit 2 (subunit N)
MITNFDLIAILPDILLLGLIAIVMIVDVFRKKHVNGNTLSWITFLGLLIIILVTLLFLSPGNTTRFAWGGMIRVDAASFTF